MLPAIACSHAVHRVMVNGGKCVVVICLIELSDFLPAFCVVWPCSPLCCGMMSIPSLWSIIQCYKADPVMQVPDICFPAYLKAKFLGKNFVKKILYCEELHLCTMNFPTENY